MQNDGTFSCKRCRTPLNITDRNCWRCGSLDIEDLREPVPVRLDDKGEIVWELVADQAGMDEVLRQWATGPAFGGTS